MSKSSKKKQQTAQKPEIEKQSDYYKLKTQAVEDLIHADESNSPEVSEEELRYYRSGPKLKLADWVKILFIKFWFAGAACFFLFWGLANYIPSMLDLLFITGVAMGIITDILTNNAIRFFEKTPGEYARWMMFPKKGYASFPLNILYAGLVLFLVFCLYSGINFTITRLTGDYDAVPLGVEPILFGLFYTGCDLLLIQIKHLIQGWVKKGKRTK